MFAVVVHGKNDLRVDELPQPTPGPQEVLIGVEWGGICGSDLAYVGSGISGTAVLKNPMVLGHEISGRVAAVGEGVDGAFVGQAVTVYPPTLVGDHVLPKRLAGRDNLYPQVRYFGSAALDPHTDGGFAQYKVARADQIIVLPQGLDTKIAALAEPTAVALHAINRAGQVLAGGVSGRDILVNGAGPIGLLVIALAKHFGAASITAVDLSPAALELARKVGATSTVCVPEQDLTGEYELVFEASGAPQGVTSVLGATARGGAIIQVGNLPAAPITAVLGALVSKEIIWTGSFRFVEREMREAVDLLGAGLGVSCLVTHEFAATEAAAAFAAASDKTLGASKVLLHFS